MKSSLGITNINMAILIFIYTTLILVSCKERIDMRKFEFKYQDFKTVVQKYKNSNDLGKNDIIMIRDYSSLYRNPVSCLNTIHTLDEIENKKEVFYNYLDGTMVIYSNQLGSAIVLKRFTKDIDSYIEKRPIEISKIKRNHQQWYVKYSIDDNLLIFNVTDSLKIYKNKEVVRKKLDAFTDWYEE